MSRILEAAERLDALHTDACERLETGDERLRLRYQVGLTVAHALYRLDYWLSIPWRCRLTGHAPERREHYNLDACAVEEAWLECARCGHWGGHLPEGVRSPR